MTSPTPLDERLRAAFAAVAEATPVDDRPFDEERAAPRSVRPVVIAIAAALVLALVGATLARTGHDDRVRTLDTPLGAPFLGPLPRYLIGALPLESIEVTRGTSRVTTEEPGWFVQVVSDPAQIDHLIEVLTVPPIPARKTALEQSYPVEATAGVAVQGEPARQRVVDGTQQLWWPGGGATGVVLSGRGVSGEQLLAVADGLRPRPGSPGFDLGHLPPGWQPLAEGERGADPVRGDQWSLDASFTVPGGDALQLRVRSVTPLEVAESRATTSGSITPIEVGGHSGQLADIASQGSAAATWWPSPGLQATLETSGPGAVGRMEEGLSRLREVDESAFRAALPATALFDADQRAIVDEVRHDTETASGDWEALRSSPIVTGRARPARLVVGDRAVFVYHLFGAVICDWMRSWADQQSVDPPPEAEVLQRSIDILERSLPSWSLTARYREAGIDPSLQVVANALHVMRTGDVAAAASEAEGCR